MTISEAERFVMKVGLRSPLGHDVANALVEHLPPSGWSDVARKQDFEPTNYRLTDSTEPEHFFALSYF